MDEGERNRTEDRSSGTPQESDDDDDPMDGSLSELSSSEDGHDDASEDGHVSGLSEGEEESDTSEFGDPFEGILYSRRKRARRSNLITYTPSAVPMAKRHKLEKATPSKLKKSGLSRRVQGRLQNVLSLPLDVLFAVSSRHPRLLTPKFNLPLDIIGTDAYGSPEPRAHEQDLAAGFNVAKVKVGLDRRATKRRCYSGP